MIVIILHEHGYDEAMLGLSLSHGQPVDKMPHIAERLCQNQSSDSGHLKFLESISVWLDITAPRYWWPQFDTYRLGVTKQSDSTMHNLMKHELTLDDFEDPLPFGWMGTLNEMIKQKKFDELKNALPEGFLQRRVVCCNYKSLRHIIEQRGNHRLGTWEQFISEVARQLAHPEFLGE